MRKLQLVRLVGASLMLLVGATFCHIFSRFQLDAFVHGAGFAPQELPVVCVWLARYSFMLLLPPPLLLAIGLPSVLRGRSPSALVELLVQIGLLGGLALVVVCILAWQLPYMGVATEPL